MSRAQKAPARARQGDTTAAVISTIRDLETNQVDWTEHTIAERCELSAQHVRNILKTLTFHGTLRFKDDVVVRKTMLVLTDSQSPSAAA